MTNVNNIQKKSYPNKSTTKRWEKNTEYNFKNQF